MAHAQLQALVQLQDQLKSADLESVTSWQKSLTAILAAIDSDPQVLAEFKTLLAAGGKSANGTQKLADSASSVLGIRLLAARSDQLETLQAAIAQMKASSAWHALVDTAKSKAQEWADKQTQAGLKILVYEGTAVQETSDPDNWKEGKNEALNQSLAKMAWIFPQRGAGWQCKPGWEVVAGNCVAKVGYQLWDFSTTNVHLLLSCAPLDSSHPTQGGQCNGVPTNVNGCTWDLRVLFSGTQVQFNLTENCDGTAFPSPGRGIADAAYPDARTASGTRTLSLAGRTVTRQWTASRTQ